MLKMKEIYTMKKKCAGVSNVWEGEVHFKCHKVTWSLPSKRHPNITMEPYEFSIYIAYTYWRCDFFALNFYFFLNPSVVETRCFISFKCTYVIQQLCKLC